jgi:hypothetical protein
MVAGDTAPEQAPSLADKLNALDRALYVLSDAKTERLGRVLDFAQGVVEDYNKFDKPPSPLESRAPKLKSKLLDLLKTVIQEHLFRFHIPRVLGSEGHDREGSTPEWTTDEEFGRQVLAGQNACVLQLVEQLPADCHIKDADLQGSNVESLIKEQKLFMVDYQTGWPLEYAPKINTAAAEGRRHQYAGRAFLELRESADNLPYMMPIAIELTDESGFDVYTPEDGAVWLLAKTVFNSIDSSVHQLYSHFVRTHASVEPYLIATRRQLSAMHPVYKLLLPHFRFTLAINANARANLIDAGGIIERCFTPGEHSMAISSAMYAQSWTFDTQGLPGDLASRGLAILDKDGNIASLLLKDYPYADDGKLVWEALVDWVGTYLKMYEVTHEDTQVQTWWEEIKTKGHPDIKKGWPELNSTAALTQILATIMWTASAHHAAVNFGQYDYSGWMPNHPSKVRKPIPRKGSAEHKALVGKRPMDKKVQNVFFETFSSPLDTVQVMVTIQLLSSHSVNEQYISDLEHYYLTDDKAHGAYLDYVRKLREAEQKMARRNEEGAAGKSRVRGYSESSRGMDYTLLSPGPAPLHGDIMSGQGKAPAGILFRGVPPSISI